MVALVIGGAGFVGGYLIDHLLNDYEWKVVATKLENEVIDIDNVVTYNLDILDRAAIVKILIEVRPDYIFHLAAQSSVSYSWRNPAVTVDVNIKGSINIFESIREVGYNPRLLLIGSGEEYGHILPGELPIKENNSVRPGNIYAVTKSCQNMLGKVYAEAYQLDIIMVRAFNHIGPKQTSSFVVPDFCKQVVEIEKGIREPVIRVGNLSAKRDFTDVRDVVRAYSSLIQNGKRGEIYNIGSGSAVTIEYLLKLILSYSNSIIKVEVDSVRLRPIDIPLIVADISKLESCIQWSPQISLDKTVKDVLDYWREII